MRSIAIAVLALACFGTGARADEKVSQAEAKSIQEAIEPSGCFGGEMEKETEGTGVYEVDDATCKDGQYDIKLDKDFNVLSMTRD